MIDDSSSLSHTSIEHYAGGFVFLGILKDAEGFVQHLNDLLWLCILKLMTMFIIHSCSHHTMHSRAVIEPLQISISHRMECVIVGSLGTIEVWSNKLVTV